MPSLITAAMREAVGAEISRSVSLPVDNSDIRRWALATYWPQSPPARFTGPGPLTAPEEFNPFAWARSAHRVAHDSDVEPGDPNHVEACLGIRGPALGLGLNAGMSVTYGVPIVAGDVITRIQTLGGYREREGRSGPLLFTTVDETWTNQDDDLVRRLATCLVRR
jgi:hypothetical protein